MKHLFCWQTGLLATGTATGTTAGLMMGYFGQNIGLSYTLGCLFLSVLVSVTCLIFVQFSLEGEN